MSLSMTGVIGMRVTDLGVDTKVKGSAMRSAQIKIDNVCTLCTIRKIVHGKVSNLNPETPTKVEMSVFPTLRQTPHAALGLVDVQITTKEVKFYAYIHADHLKKFFGAFADSVVRADLDL